MRRYPGSDYQYTHPVATAAIVLAAAFASVAFVLFGLLVAGVLHR